MKKILMALLMVLMFWNVSEGQTVKSVAGIEFGTDKQTAISDLIDHFGYDYKEEGDAIIFYNVTIGGIYYDFANFYFRYSKFVSADFYSAYTLSKVNDAKDKRESIYNVYIKKYFVVEERTNEAGFKYYVIGASVYKDDNHYPIMIYISKSESKGGDMFYYVHTKYYPHLLDYTDEI